MTTADGQRLAVVSVKGREGATGRGDDPFRRLTDAVRWLEERRRAVPAAEEHGDLVIHLLPGEHRIDEPIMLGPHSAGTASSNTVIEGEPGAILMGSRPIESSRWWEPARWGRRIRGVAIPGVPGVPLDLGAIGFALPLVPAPPALVARGAPYRMARWPKEGWLRTTGPAEPDAAGRQVLQLDPAVLQHLHGQRHLWVEAFLCYDWEWYQAPVFEIDFASGRVVTGLPRTSGDMLPGGDRIAFLNDRRALQSPGECWLDPQQRRMEYVPFDHGPKPELCVFPHHLLQLHETRFARIRGLHLVGGLASAVYARGCEDIAVEGCEIEQFGAGGLHLEGARFTVRGCSIHDVGTTGLRLDSGDSATLTSGGSVVEGCSFERWGRRKPVYEPAVRLLGVGSEVRDSTFRNGPHMAIDVAGNDHRIDGNRFSRVAEATDDMGAIYVNQGEDPLQRGYAICHNVFFDIGDGHEIASAVYVDRRSEGVTVFRNLCVRIASHGPVSVRAVHGNGPSWLRIEENLFIDCDIAIGIGFYLANWGERDIQTMTHARAAAVQRLAGPSARHLERYPELAQLGEEDLVFPATNSVVNNHAWTREPLEQRGLVVRSAPAELVRSSGNRVVARDAVDAAAIAGLPAAWQAIFPANTPVDRAIEDAIRNWDAVVRLLRAHSAGEGADNRV